MMKNKDRIRYIQFADSLFKPTQSVRSQRSFQEHMKTLYQNIYTLVYAGEVACRMHTTPTHSCDGCPFDKWHGCKLKELRDIVGDHFPQSDIETVELSED